MKKLTLFGLILAFSISSLNTFAKDNLLRLNLEKGKSYSMSTSMDMKYFSDATLSEKIMSTYFDFTIDMKVLDKAKDGTHTIEVIVTGVKGTQEMQGMSISYDSKDPESGGPMGAMIGQQLEPILNKPTTIKVNNMGKATSDESEEGQVMSIAGIAQQLFLEMPEKEVKEGSTWSQKQDVPTTGQQMEVIFKVVEMSKKEVSISYDFNQDKMDLGEEAGQADIKSKGKALLNPKTGRLIQNSLNQTIKGSNPQMGGEFFMVNSISTKTL